MQEKPPSSQPVLDMLRRAGALHSRHRALALVLRSVVWLGVSILLLFLSDVLLHHSDPVRLAGAIGTGLAILIILGISACVACFVRPPLLRVARLLEARNPGIGSKLVNILQLDAEAGRAVSDPLTRELALRAVADAGKALNLSALGPSARDPHLPRHFLKALGAVAGLAVFTLAGGRHARQEWLRFLDPFGDHPPFSLTYLEIIKPVNDSTVIYGASVIVNAKASGHQPRELFLTASPADKTGKAITLPMSARGDGTFVSRFDNVREPMEIAAHAGDGGSRSHRLRIGVVLTPQFGPSLVRITPPDYTGQEALEIPYRFAALQVLEGTEIGFRIASNRPLGKGHIRFESGEGAAELVSLVPSVDGPPDTAVANLAGTRSARLTFSLVDVEGNVAAESPSALLTVTRDLPPSIAISAPENDALVVEDLAVPVNVDATDDYGIRSMRLHIGINGKFQTVVPVSFETPDTRRHRIDHSLDLKSLGAVAGDKITLFAEAVDTRPEPQIARSAIRSLEVITEARYNDLLRERADVAMIAGKYEAVLERIEQQVMEQRRIEEKLAALREKPGGDTENPELLREFAEIYADQVGLNERLEQTADAMAEFGRDEPVYDFEKDLHEKLRRQAARIRESVEKNRLETEETLEKGSPPPEPPNLAMIEGVESAARGQRERLQGGGDRAREEILEPLADLARLHELMKDFNRFEEFTAGQLEIAEQIRAYHEMPQLNAEDRLALRDLGARQRELAPKLDQLADKLRHDADAATGEFPEAAASARTLADQIDAGDLAELARRAAQSMLDSKPAEAGAQARHLHEAMDLLFCDACQKGGLGVAQGFDHALRLQRGMNPGDSFKQMMLSRNFRPLPGEGMNGAGLGGFMASSAMEGSPMLLGGESLLDGPIASSIAGKGDTGGSGVAGSPTARLDPADPANVEIQSARRTGTPGSGTLLLEYESIADAYFRRLTTKP